jgi:pimeloyl-ACP methyl ester carboxylesterase
VSYAVIPAAGSAGLTWERVTELLACTRFEVPDRESVEEMASTLAEGVAALPRPRVLVGASLGAMVSLELTRLFPVDALVLIAAGFGMPVGESIMEWIAANPSDLLQTMAENTVADRQNHQVVETIVRDFEARGQPVLLRHLQALRSYHPLPLESPPPTVVIWGQSDGSVPLASHAELAIKCAGVLVPVPGAAHNPQCEQPEETAKWIRWAARWAEAAGRTRPPRGNPAGDAAHT